MNRKQPYKSGLIIEGWNDWPRLCPKRGCKGLVIATNDIRYGQCTSCLSLVRWSTFHEQSLKRCSNPQKSSKNP